MTQTPYLIYQPKILKKNYKEFEKIVKSKINTNFKRQENGY